MFYGLMDPEFYLHGLYFLVLSFLLLWLPSWIFPSKYTKLRRTTRIFLAPIIGIIFLTTVTFVGGMIGFYDLMFYYVGAVVMVDIWMIGKYVRKTKIKQNAKKIWRGVKSNWVLLALIAAGLLIQMPAIWGSGLRMSEGVNFYFTNNQDGLMHLGFINSLSREFPPMRAEMNISLENYHYFADLLTAQYVRLGLPGVNLFFQYWPVMLSVLTTGVIYQAMREVTKDRRVAGWTTVMFLLAGDGGYWLSLIFANSRGWEMATFDNGADQFLNMPYAFSKVIFFAGWMLLNHYWQTKRKMVLAILALLAATLTLFKVYWAILLLGGWGMTVMVRLVKDRAWKRYVEEMSALIVAAAASGVLLLSIKAVGGEPLTWTPLVWPRIMISADHLGWDSWFLREQVFAADQNWLRLTIENVMLVGVALIFVFGARLFGLVVTKKSRQLLGVENTWFFLSSFVIWTVVGFNVMQGKGGLNSFNFLIIAAVALLVPLGINVSEWWARSNFGKVLVIVILLLLVPRTLYNAWFYGQKTLARDEREGFYSRGRLELLQKLAEVTPEEGLVAVNPDNQSLRKASVIAGLAGRKTYLSNQAILESHNVDFAERELQMERLFAQIAGGTFVQAARDLKIDHVYLESYDLEKLQLGAEIWEYVEASNEAGMILRISERKNDE